MILLNRGYILLQRHADSNPAFSLFKNYFAVYKFKFPFLLACEKKGLSGVSNISKSKLISASNIKKAIPLESNQIQIITNGIKKFQNNFVMHDIEILKANVLANGKKITEVNFDAMFLTICGNENSFLLGKKYFEFVYLNLKENCNIGIIGKFFRLCYDCKDDCFENEKTLMFDLYKKLILKYDILDSKTCENVALGLSITVNWKECFKLLEMCSFTSVPSSKMYSAIIQAAFNNNEINMGRDLLREMVSCKHIPQPDVYISWLCASKFTKTCFRNIFQFFENYDIHPSLQLVQLLSVNYEKYHKTGKHFEVTTINSSGKCQMCHQQLKPVVVTEAEFQKLKTTFLDPVLIGNDTFLKTKPKEIESFNNFLKKVKNVDIVLDGLNIALSPTHKNHNVDISAQVLCNVVEHLNSQSKTVLILGRKHMNLWPKLKINYLKQNAFVFLVDDVSSDDPFLLYATMYFGLGTYFVSRDQMRSHKFLLKDPELMIIFSKWQQKHQYYFQYATEYAKVSLKEPVPYLQSPQQTGKGVWHIPISSDMTGVPPHIVPIKRKWLCFQES